MTLRKSETVFRLLIGVALALGFVGFATQSDAPHEPHAALVAAGPSSVDL